MSEPEFLPDWYVERRRRREQRAVLGRLGLVALACGVCMSGTVGAISLKLNGADGPAARDASAIAPATAPPPQPSKYSPTPSLPASAARVMELLERAAPPGLVISDIVVRAGQGAAAPADPSDSGGFPGGSDKSRIAVLAVEITAEAPDQSTLADFVESVRRSGQFQHVEARPTVASRRAAGHSLLIRLKNGDTGFAHAD